MTGARTQRVLALLLIGIQAAAIALLAEALAFPLLVALAALGGVFVKKPLHLTEANQSKLYIALAVLFLLRWIIAPQSFRPEAVFPAPVITQFSYATAECLLVIQTMQLYLAHRNDRLPLSLPGLGAVALACAFDVRVTAEQRLICQVLTVGFTGVAAAYFSACRIPFDASPRKRRSAILLPGALVLGVAGAVGWAASSGLYRNERAIEEMLALLLESGANRQQPGFSGHARLGNVAAYKGSGAESIALRVRSESEPGYLRGRAFDHYDRSEWLTTQAGFRLEPLASPPQSLMPPDGTASVFGSDTMETDVETNQWRQLESWPAASLVGNLFTPLGTSHVRAAAAHVTMDGNGVFATADLPESHPYTSFVPVSGRPRPLPDALKTQFLTVPSSLEPGVHEFAEALFANCRTTAQKVAAVERHFHENYTYQLGMRVPGREDPLNWFLREKPPAHCEYFASGAAVLLRLAGVPSRYVTGFVAEEQNSYGGHWIARNRDAHAWAEAWDEDRGWWLTVEATPAVGVPTPSKPSRFQQLREAAAAKVHYLRIRLQQGGLWGVAGALLRALLSGPVVVGLAGAATTCLLLRWRIRQRNRALQDPRLLMLHRLLGEMDAHLKRLHCLREPGETLNQFAARIRSSAVTPRSDELASWYETYAEHRYARPDDLAGIEHLASWLSERRGRALH